MVLVRILLVAIVALTVSLSGAMASGHPPVAPHDHAVVAGMDHDHPDCCMDSTERGQSCHILPALLPLSESHDPAPVAGEDVVVTPDLLLTGVEPTGPFEPPCAA